MESVSGSDVRWRRVGAVGLGNRAREDFARGMHRHVALSRGFRHGTLLQSTVTGHPSQGIDTGYCHRIPSQDTDTGHPSLEALPRISATDKCRGSTSQWHINRVGGKRSSFLPTFVFRPLTPPYVRFRIRRFFILRAI